MGVLDPLAALTWNVADPVPTRPVNEVIVPQPPPPPPDMAPRQVATYTLLGVVALGVAVVGVVFALRRKQSR